MVDVDSGGCGMDVYVVVYVSGWVGRESDVDVDVGVYVYVYVYAVVEVGAG